MARRKFGPLNKLDICDSCQSRFLHFKEFEIFFFQTIPSHIRWIIERWNLYIIDLSGNFAQTTIILFFRILKLSDYFLVYINFFASANTKNYWNGLYQRRLKHELFQTACIIPKSLSSKIFNQKKWLYQFFLS